MSHKLVAEIRTSEGKGAARRLRSTGLIPAVVYGGKGGNAQPVAVSPKVLTKILLGDLRRNAVIELDVQEGGKSREKVMVMVKDLQRQVVRRTALHVDFIRVFDDVEVNVAVPFQTSGKSEAMVQGGKLNMAVRELRISTKPKNIPVNITLDLTKVEYGAFRAGNVPLPEGVSLREDVTATVLTIKTPRGAKAEVEGEGETAEAPAES
ncbi:MAG: 50S ribosomal protein L25 [Deltaproteobacteria bacterium]|nr:50S ribosomal protein L25 [Deltaproteobacteria bacterium]